MNKIEFIPNTEYFEKNFMPPVPSYKNIPNWIKKVPSYVNGRKNPLHHNGGSNLTAKWCVPLMDSYTSGYQIVLAADLSCDNDTRYINRIQWQLDYEFLIENQSTSQLPGVPIPKEYEDSMYKFSTGWGIKTPKGYSCLLIHPINRFELPFYSLSAIVDTDSYHTAINIPFLLKKDYNGIIEKGTPIAQIIPFKREDWKSISKKYKKENENNYDIIFTKIQRFYRNLHWKRKRYI